MTEPRFWRHHNLDEAYAFFENVRGMRAMHTDLKKVPSEGNTQFGTGCYVLTRTDIDSTELNIEELSAQAQIDFPLLKHDGKEITPRLNPHYCLVYLMGSDHIRLDMAGIIPVTVERAAEIPMHELGVKHDLPTFHYNRNYHRKPSAKFNFSQGQDGYDVLHQLLSRVNLVLPPTEE